MYTPIREDEAYKNILKQNENLITNGLVIRNFHPEEGILRKSEHDKMSFGTISSADERDCDIMFKGEYIYRFQAVKKIQQENVDALHKKVRDNEREKKQNSKWNRFIMFILCRKSKIWPGKKK